MNKFLTSHLLTQEQIKGKRILICFFDYQQRPSRNCIQELSKKVKEFEENDIQVIVIHASKIEQGTFDEWLKDDGKLGEWARMQVNNKSWKRKKVVEGEKSYIFLYR